MRFLLIDAHHLIKPLLAWYLVLAPHLDMPNALVGQSMSRLRHFFPGPRQGKYQGPLLRRDWHRQTRYDWQHYIPMI